MIPALASLIPTIVEKGMDLFDKKFETDSQKLQKKAEFEKDMINGIKTKYHKN